MQCKYRGAIASRLTAARKQRGWTLRETARASRISIDTIRDIEGGFIVGHTYETIILAAILRVNLEELIPDSAGSEAEQLKDKAIKVDAIFQSMRELLRGKRDGRRIH